MSRGGAPMDPSSGGEQARLAARYRRIREHLRDVYLELTPEGVICEVTPSCERVLGWKREHLLGRNLRDFHRDPTEWDRALERIGSGAPASDEDDPSQELDLEGPTGETVHVELSLAVVDEPGDGRLLVGTLREVGRRRAAEQALRLSEELFRKAFYTSPDAISITRADDGKMVDVNQGFTDITGWRRAEVIGRSTVDLGLWVDLPTRDRMAQAIKTLGYVDNLETHFRTKDGRIIFGLFSAKVIDLGGEPHLLSVARDLTEYKRLEQQLLRAQKMEAVGRLASGIAHDFNNLLTVIRGFARAARERVAPDDDQGLEAIEQIDRAAVRAAALTRQLLAFGRKQVLLPVNVQLNDLLDRMAQMLGRLLPETIDLRLDLAPDLGVVRADPGQLEQVVANLVVNARDAMPEGGALHIRTRNVEGDGNGEPGPGRVELSVADTGEGMDDEVRNRIFEPFFTTKERDRGTGLGLATVYGIVRQSGGEVGVETAPGEGTRFRIRFPRVQAPADVPEAEGPVPTGNLSGRETVVLAEDEGALRAVLARALRDRGYVVLEAETGTRALELVRSHAGPVHALITDIIMPGMHGSDLVRQVRLLRPELPVVLMSGYVDEETLAGLPTGPDVTFLRKVFTPHELLLALRRLLDRPRSHADTRA